MSQKRMGKDIGVVSQLEPVINLEVVKSLLRTEVITTYDLRSTLLEAGFEFVRNTKHGIRFRNPDNNREGQFSRNGNRGSGTHIKRHIREMFQSMGIDIEQFDETKVAQNTQKRKGYKRKNKGNIAVLPKDNIRIDSEYEGRRLRYRVEAGAWRQGLSNLVSPDEEDKMRRLAEQNQSQVEEKPKSQYTNFFYLFRDERFMHELDQTMRIEFSDSITIDRMKGSDWLTMQLKRE